MILRELVLTNNVMRGHAHENLMQNSRDEEDGKARRGRLPSAADQGHVDVALKVGVHRAVPGAPISTQAHAVPPVVIEEAIAKSKHLGQRVEEGLEQSKEASEPDNERNGRQLQQALEDRRDIQRGNLVERVAKDGRGVLGAGHPHKDTQANDLTNALADKDPANLVGARVDGLVDKRRSPPKVDEVLDGDVLRVGA